MGRLTQTDWEKMERKRSDQLGNMKNTKSYIPKEKLSSRNKIYFIHDNGGRPFKVVANSNGIDIMVIDYDTQKYTKFKHINNFQGYWSGFDSSPYSLESDDFHGNSILIKINDHKYIEIGLIIFSFSTKDIILDYVSYVGNNDVPYPIAYGEKYAYFMLEKQMCEIDSFVTKPSVANSNDMYIEFYGITKGSAKFKQKKSSNMLNVKIIHDRVE